jgi:lysophospholipase L1-like esterase
MQEIGGKGHVDMEKWMINTLSALQTDDGWKPQRFTESQYREYAKTEARLLRSRCPAGVGLEFRTDASLLKLDFKVVGTTRKFAYFDLFVDGSWRASDRFDPIDSGMGKTATFALPDDGAMHRVTLYLPHTVELVLLGITLSPGAAMEPAESRPKRYLALGDSITQGILAKHPAGTYPMRIANQLNMQLLNQGVGGYVFEEASLDEALPYQPDLITVAYGTNDWNICHSIEEFRDKCSRYMRKLARLFPDAPIVVLTPLWRLNAEEITAVGAFTDIHRAIAEICEPLTNVTVLDGLNLLPHLPELFADKVHPTDEGSAQMALSMLKFLRE